MADVILLGDSFAALPVAFREGQRIVKGMEDVVRLLLTRTLYVLLLVIATRIVEVPFPVTPKHNSILALLTVGIPILAIAAWARPGAPPRSVMRSTSHFILPAAFTIAIVALAVYLAYLGMTGDAQVARTALTTATVFCGLLLIPFVEPPTRFWEGGDDLSGDWRPTILALGMLLAYGVVLAVPGLRGFFELSPLRLVDYLIIAASVAIWALLLRLIWRTKLFERVLARTLTTAFRVVYRLSGERAQTSAGYKSVQGPHRENLAPGRQDHLLHVLSPDREPPSTDAGDDLVLGIIRRTPCQAELAKVLTVQVSLHLWPPAESPQPIFDLGHPRCRGPACVPPLAQMPHRQADQMAVGDASRIAQGGPNVAGLEPGQVLSHQGSNALRRVSELPFRDRPTGTADKDGIDHRMTPYR